MPLHVGKGMDVSTAIADIIDYVENPQKTDFGKFIYGYECDTRIADAEFLLSNSNQHKSKQSCRAKSESHPQRVSASKNIQGQSIPSDDKQKAQQSRYLSEFQFFLCAFFKPYQIHK